MTIIVPTKELQFLDLVVRVSGRARGCFLTSGRGSDALNVRFICIVAFVASLAVLFRRPLMALPFAKATQGAASANAVPRASWAPVANRSGRKAGKLAKGTQGMGRPKTGGSRKDPPNDGLSLAGAEPGGKPREASATPA